MCVVLEAYMTAHNSSNRKSMNCVYYTVAIAILLAMFLRHFIVAQLKVPCVAIHFCITHVK